MDTATAWGLQQRGPANTDLRGLVHRLFMPCPKRVSGWAKHRNRKVTGSAQQAYGSGGAVALAESDAELVLRVRVGDNDAFEVLFERHRGMARHVAAGQTDNLADVEDVVADAFASVFQSLAAGKGPDEFFRAYLLTAVRRTAHKANCAGSRTRPTDESFVLDSALVHDDTVLAEFESTAVARAFKALPERWQEVLWYVDIEGMKPAAASTLLGVTPNGVSSLALRARERLRQVYLQNHVGESVGEDCEEYSAQLGVYARNGLSKRSRDKVQAHLEECPKCTALLLDLDDVQSAMRAVIFPLIAGIAFTSAVPALSAATTGAGAGAAGHAVWKSMPLKVGAGVLTAVAVVVGAAVAMGGTGTTNSELPVAEVAPTSDSLPSVPVGTAPEDDGDIFGPGPQGKASLPPAPGLPSTQPAPGTTLLPSLPDAERGRNFPSPSSSAQNPLLSLPPLASTVPTTLPALAPTAAPVPTPNPSATLIPTPGPSPTETNPNASDVTATFRAEAGTTASDANIFITFSLQGGNVPASAETVFTISAGADMIPGKLIEPPGWSCTSGAADTRQFRCTSSTVDPNRLGFSLGVSKKDSGETTTIDYQFGGTGIRTTAFSNTF